MPIVAFGDIGKAAKGLLGGDKPTGTFTFDPKLSVSSTTASGVALTATAVQKADKVEASLKAAYSTKKYSVDVALSPDNKVTATAAINDVAPGIKLTTSAVLPDPATAKLTLDYSMPYLALKSTIGLNATPVVDVAASTGYQSFVLGAETSYDTAKAAVTKYNFALGRWRRGVVMGTCCDWVHGCWGIVRRAEQVGVRLCPVQSYIYIRCNLQETPLCRPLAPSNWKKLPPPTHTHPVPPRQATMRLTSRWLPN